MFDRLEGGNRALLVAVNVDNGDGAAVIEEFRRLAQATRAQIVGFVSGSRRQPDPKFFVGSGKAQEIAQAVTDCDADLVIVNHSLSPAQERNLEALVKARVLDRNGMILDIFARRARTHEGKLQVELAQLRHLATRLVRGWSHLERQKGGIGLRGPGESQLETDRRLINDRMRRVERRIDQVRHSRALNRQRRDRQEVPLVSLVGYTNAGKSTLFERLTGASVFVADQLFATLDTTLRQLHLDSHEPAIIADTVGFVRDLPHTLISAFRATLEETVSAQLLLHVLDAADPERDAQQDAVESVLEEIGAGTVPRLEVYNKLDCLPDALPRIDRDEFGVARRVWISAGHNAGIELLQQAIGERLYPALCHWQLRLPPQMGRLRAELFRLNAVLGERYDAAGTVEMTVRLDQAKMQRMISHAGLNPASVARIAQG